MSLSNHEQNQFNLLAKSFVSDDPVLAAKLEKQTKKTAMTHFSPQDISMVAFGGMILGAILFISAFFANASLSNLYAVFGGPALVIFSWAIHSFYKHASEDNDVAYVDN